jgi:hypothetical protein
MAVPTKPEPLIDQIPDPQTVRDWLAKAIRQAAILRCLLRVAEQKANHRSRPVRHEEATPCNP